MQAARLLVAFFARPRTLDCPSVGYISPCMPIVVRAQLIGACVRVRSHPAFWEVQVGRKYSGPCHSPRSTERHDQARPVPSRLRSRLKWLHVGSHLSSQHAGHLDHPLGTHSRRHGTCCRCGRMGRSLARYALGWPNASGDGGVADGDAELPRHSENWVLLCVKQILTRAPCPCLALVVESTVGHQPLKTRTFESRPGRLDPQRQLF